MTTIAYHHESKTVAVDSRATNSSGFISTDSANKAIINERGTWVLAGPVCDFNEYAKLSNRDSTDLSLECSALLIADGKCYLTGINDGEMWMQELLHNYAIGSGSNFAIAALDFEKGAVDSVRYACERDAFSGGDIVAVDVETGEIK